MNSTKPFNISKHIVLEAFRRVKANKGVAGIDEESINEFEKRLKDNLYKIWNRMSSGSYFPPSVMSVDIPKKNGSKRTLGIPTVADRVAQMVAKLYLEPEIEPHFHKDSYGYRPGKSAHDALSVTRKRCWEYDWVLEFDIKAAFDNIDHELLLRALRKHTDSRWILMYVERWLKVPFEKKDGTLITRKKGTPQGGVISPLLANLFFHYAFDKWMERRHPGKAFCRYADDGLVHCRTYEEAKFLRRQLQERFQECNLSLNGDKTKIVYCKDKKRKEKFENIKFDFLGFTFRPRRVKSQYGYFVGFTPAISNKAAKGFREKVRKAGITRQIDKTIIELADIWNPVIRGWIQYYGRFYKSELYGTLNHFNLVLLKWARRKYKRLKYSRRKAKQWLGRVAKQSPELFVSWKYVKPTVG